MEKYNELMYTLAALVIKNNNKELGLRVQELADKSKVEIVDGLEKIISEIKTGDLKSTSPLTQTIKHVYRTITS